MERNVYPFFISQELAFVKPITFHPPPSSLSVDPACCIAWPHSEKFRMELEAEVQSGSCHSSPA